MVMELCPCGSSTAYSECCEPLITGRRTATTAEQLMRSRYSAYVKVATEYLYSTTHPAHRENYDHKGTQEWAENSDWEGLEIVEARRGGPEDSTGEVEFIARFGEKGTTRAHHELALFKKDEATWFFTDGKMVGQKPITSNKVGRNEPCPCGSGMKYKKCCGA